MAMLFAGGVVAGAFARLVTGGARLGVKAPKPEPEPEPAAEPESDDCHSELKSGFTLLLNMYDMKNGNHSGASMEEAQTAVNKEKTGTGRFVEDGTAYFNVSNKRPLVSCDIKKVPRLFSERKDGWNKLKNNFLLGNAFERFKNNEVFLSDVEGPYKMYFQQDAKVFHYALGIKFANGKVASYEVDNQEAPCDAIYGHLLVYKNEDELSNTKNPHAVKLAYCIVKGAVDAQKAVGNQILFVLCYQLAQTNKCDFLITNVVEPNIVGIPEGASVKTVDGNDIVIDEPIPETRQRVTDVKQGFSYMDAFKSPDYNLPFLSNVDWNNALEIDDKFLSSENPIARMIPLDEAAKGSKKEIFNAFSGIQYKGDVTKKITEDVAPHLRPQKKSK